MGNGINTDGSGNKLGDTVYNSVYLGDNSSVRKNAGYNLLKNSSKEGKTRTGGAWGNVSSAKIGGVTFGTFAGADSVGAVSVGASGAERRIQNLAAGEVSATSTDGINGSQLYATNQVLSNVAGTVADMKNTINKFGFFLTASKSDGEVSGGKATPVKAGDTLTLDAGKNISLVQDEGKISVATAGKASFQSVTADQTAGDGNDTTLTEDGLIINKKDGYGNSFFTSITTAKGNDENNTAGSTTVDGTTLVNRIQYTTNVSMPDGTVKNVTVQTATMEDGLKFKGDNETVLFRKLNQQLDVVGGADNMKLTEKDIGVNSTDDGKLKVQLAKELKDLTSVTATDEAGNTTVTSGSSITMNKGDNLNPGGVPKDGDKTVSLTYEGLSNGGNKITHVADGEISETSTEAVNGGQLFKMVGKSALEVKAGSHVGLIKELDPKDSHRVYTVNAAGIATDDSNLSVSGGEVDAGTGKVTDYRISLSQDPQVNSVKTGNTSLSKDGVVIGSSDDSGKSVSLTKEGLDNGGNTITHVAPGKNDTDAVNVAQLNERSAAIAQSVNKLGVRVDRVGARAAALAALHPLDFEPDDKWDFAAGYGHYRGANAASAGAFYRPNEDTMFSIGGSFGGGENMLNAGVSLKLGQGNHVSTSKVAMAKELVDLRNENRDLKKRLDTMEEKMNALLQAMGKGSEFPAEESAGKGETHLDRFRVDLVSGKEDDKDKIERVRVNDEDNAQQ